MPRRKSLTRRLIQHLLLISLARTILTADRSGPGLGRVGRAEARQTAAGGAAQAQAPLRPDPLLLRPLLRRARALRGRRQRRAHAARQRSRVVGRRDRGHRPDRPDRRNRRDRRGLGHTGLTGLTAHGARRPGAAAGRRRATDRPSLHGRDGEAATAVVSRPLATPAAPTKQAARVTTKIARPALAKTRARTPPRSRSRLRRRRRSTPRSRRSRRRRSGCTGPRPTRRRPAARLKMGFARSSSAYSRAAHVDWALVLATLRAEGHNDRAPASVPGLHALAFKLSGFGGRANPWAAALAYSSDTSLRRPGRRASPLLPRRRAREPRQRPALAEGRPAGPRPPRPAPADLPGRPERHRHRQGRRPGARGDALSGGDATTRSTVSCLISGHRLYARPGVVSAHIYGRAVDIAALNGISIYGHQQPGGITEQGVRSLLMLPGGMLPAQVISLLGMGGPSFAAGQPRRPHPHRVLGMALPQVALANDDGNVVCEHCLLAETALARLRGLLGRSGLSSGEGMLLRPASSIHTAFMRFPIDAVFLDRGDRVLKVAPELSPWRMAACKGARAVLELPAGEAHRRGLRPGVSLTQVWRSAPGIGRRAPARALPPRARAEVRRARVV